MNGANIDEFYLTKTSDPDSTKLLQGEWCKQPIVYIQVKITSSLPYDLECINDITYSKTGNLEKKILNASCSATTTLYTFIVNTASLSEDDGTGIWKIQIVSKIGASITKKSSIKTYEIDNSNPEINQFLINPYGTSYSSGIIDWYKNFNIRVDADDTGSGLRNLYAIKYKIQDSESKNLNKSSNSGEVVSVLPTDVELEGNTTVEATVSDNVDNTVTATKSLYVDQQAPEITITRKSGKYLITLSENGCGIKRVAYEICNNDDSGTTDTSDDKVGTALTPETDITSSLISKGGRSI